VTAEAVKLYNVFAAMEEEEPRLAESSYSPFCLARFCMCSIAIIQCNLGGPKRTADPKAVTPSRPLFTWSNQHEAPAAHRYKGQIASFTTAFPLAGRNTSRPHSRPPPVRSPKASLALHFLRTGNTVRAAYVPAVENGSA
jgi:hypothetical protein